MVKKGIKNDYPVRAIQETCSVETAPLLSCLQDTPITFLRLDEVAAALGSLPGLGLWLLSAFLKHKY